MLSTGFAQAILASDIPGLAPIKDSNLINPWGLAFSPTGPFWIAENGSNVSDVLDGRGQLIPLVVTIPSASQSGSTPTGTVFNAGPGFVISDGNVSAPSRFLFANEDGTIAGWSGKVNSTSAILTVDNSNSGAVYTGLTIASDPSGASFLYAADFSHGTIDVFDRDFRPIIRPDAFQDVNLPAAFAPFNIQNISNLLFVSYAQRGSDPRATVPGPGQGFIDVYQPDGAFIERFTSQGELNSPWGLAVAPAGFGQFGGALLVGNNGDGQINAYNLQSGAFIGELRDHNSIPITIPNLWALIFGNDHAGGSSDTLFFAAGTVDAEHGLFGAIQAPEKVGSDTGGPGVFDNHGPGEPGDYPLPPSGGPVIRGIRDDQLLPISDLLPLKESSLVLVPTLSGIYSPVLSVETSAPTGPVPAVSLTGPLATDIASIFAAKSSEDGPQFGMLYRSGATPLFAFLDLDAARKDAQVQGQESRPIIAASSLAFADRDGESAALYSGFSKDRRVRQLANEELSYGLPISSEANEIIGTVPDGRTASAEEKAAKPNPAENIKRIGWASLFQFVFTFSIPIIWWNWLNNSRNRYSRETTYGVSR